MLKIFRFSQFLKVCPILLHIKKYGPRKTEPLKRILHSTVAQEYFIKDLVNHNTRNKGKKILEKGLAMIKKTLISSTLNQPIFGCCLWVAKSFLLKPVEHLLFEKMCFLILKGILAMPLMRTNNLSFVRVLLKRKCNFHRYLTCRIFYVNLGAN